jgi:hypothetical protein
MIIIFGLVVLIAAIVIGVAGVLANGGSGHALTHGFAVFGYHVTGSTGSVFLSGIEVGVVGLAGLSLLLTGVRRNSRRGSAARHGLRQSRQETAAVSRDRDDLLDQRATAFANNSHPGPAHSHRGKLRLFGRRPAPVQAPAGVQERLNGEVVPDAPTDTPAP